MPSLGLLKYHLKYDPQSGHWYRRGIGQRADTAASKGYRIVRFNGEKYSAHRLAIFYMTGKWPSGRKGVTWNIGVKKWLAFITKDGRRIHLGVFDDFALAAAARAKAEHAWHKEFARAR